MALKALQASWNSWRVIHGYRPQGRPFINKEQHSLLDDFRYLYSPLDTLINMSGIFGRFNRTGAPIEPRHVEQVNLAMRNWNADEAGTWLDKNVSFSQAMIYNTHESIQERLPNVTPRYTIVANSRLDNRAELAATLNVCESQLSITADSTLILAAYQKWGRSCPSHLLGDFAFAVWDKKEHVLFCARDHAGIKPFYYHADNEKFIFASAVEGVLAYPDILRTLDKRMIYSYIYEINQPEITFYEEISRLPPATSLLITKTHFIRDTYWRPEESPKIKLKTVEEYAESLKGLFKTAVQRRTNSVYPLGTHLSGGLDSSSIVILAARILKAKQKKLHAYSWMHPPSSDCNRSNFEWANGETIARQEDLDFKYTNTTVKTFEEIYANHDIRNMDTLDFWNEFSVRRLAASDSVRTILSGWGGDELVGFNGGVAYNAEIFWQGEILTSLRNYRGQSKNARSPFLSTGKKIFNELLLPLFSEERFNDLYNLLTKSFYEDVEPLVCMDKKFLAASKAIETERYRHLSRFGVRTEQINRYYAGTLTQRIEAWSASAIGSKIEYRYPLLDKQLIEFAFGVPTVLYRHKNIPRYLYRLAIEEILPVGMAWSETKLENERSDQNNRNMYEYLTKQSKRQINIAKHVKDGGIINPLRLASYIQDLVASELELQDLNQIKSMMIAGKAILLSKC